MRIFTLFRTTALLQQLHHIYQIYKYEAVEASTRICDGDVTSRVGLLLARFSRLEAAMPSRVALVTGAQGMAVESPCALRRTGWMSS